VIEIGRQLNAIRPLFEYGKWEPFLRDKLGLSPASARRFMQVAEAWGAKSFLGNDLAGIDRHALFMLSAPEVTEAMRIEAADRSAAGEHITVAEARKMKRLITARIARQYYSAAECEGDKT
jgi:hypothetical protein